jgi:hypothetical protein
MAVWGLSYGLVVQGVLEEFSPRTVACQDGGKVMNNPHHLFNGKNSRLERDSVGCLT